MAQPILVELNRPFFHDCSVGSDSREMGLILFATPDRNEGEARHVHVVEEARLRGPVRHVYYSEFVE